MLKITGSLNVIQLATEEPHLLKLKAAAEQAGSKFDIELSGNYLYGRSIFMGYDLANGNGDGVPSFYANPFGPSFIGKKVDYEHLEDEENRIGEIMATWHIVRDLPPLEASARPLIGKHIFGYDANPDQNCFRMTASDAEARHQQTLVEGIFRIDRRKPMGDIVAKRMIAKELGCVSQEALTAYALCPICAHKMRYPHDGVCGHLVRGSLMAKSYAVPGYKHEILAHKMHQDPVGDGLGIVKVPAFDIAQIAEITAGLKSGQMTLEAAYELIRLHAAMLGKEANSGMLVKARREFELAANDAPHVENKIMVEVPLSAEAQAAVKAHEAKTEAGLAKGVSASEGAEQLKKTIEASKTAEALDDIIQVWASKQGMDSVQAWKLYATQPTIKDAVDAMLVEKIKAAKVKGGRFVLKPAGHKGAPVEMGPQWDLVGPKDPDYAHGLELEEHEEAGPEEAMTIFNERKKASVKAAGEGAPRYKSDADIAKEFEGFKIQSFEFKNGDKDSGWIVLEFPNPGESVGGGQEEGTSAEVSTGFIVYQNGKVAFDDWFPENVYNELRDYVLEQRKKAGVKAAETKDDKEHEGALREVEKVEDDVEKLEHSIFEHAIREAADRTNGVAEGAEVKAGSDLSYGDGPINNVAELDAKIDELEGNPAAYFVCADGGILSINTVKEEIRLVKEGIEEPMRPDGRQWAVIGWGINKNDPEMTDDHTNDKIPVASPGVKAGEVKPLFQPPAKNEEKPVPQQGAELPLDNISEPGKTLQAAKAEEVDPLMGLIATTLPVKDETASVTVDKIHTQGVLEARLACETSALVRHAVLASAIEPTETAKISATATRIRRLAAAQKALDDAKLAMATAIGFKMDVKAGMGAVPAWTVLKAVDVLEKANSKSLAFESAKKMLVSAIQSVRNFHGRLDALNLPDDDARKALVAKLTASSTDTKEIDKPWRALVDIEGKLFENPALALAATDSLIKDAYGFAAKRLRLPKETQGIVAGADDAATIKAFAGATLEYLTAAESKAAETLGIGVKDGQKVTASPADRVHALMLLARGAYDFGGSLRPVVMAKIQDEVQTEITATKTARTGALIRTLIAAWNKVFDAEPLLNPRVAARAVAKKLGVKASTALLYGQKMRASFGGLWPSNEIPGGTWDAFLASKTDDDLQKLAADWSAKIPTAPGFYAKSIIEANIARVRSALSCRKQMRGCWAKLIASPDPKNSYWLLRSAEGKVLGRFKAEDQATGEFITPTSGNSLVASARKLGISRLLGEQMEDLEGLEALEEDFNFCPECETSSQVDIDSIEEGHPENKKYFCPQCRNYFKASKIVAETTPVSEEDAELGLTCLDCGKEFKAGDPAVHVKAPGIPSGYVSYCPECHGGHPVEEVKAGKVKADLKGDVTQELQEMAKLGHDGAEAALAGLAAGKYDQTVADANNMTATDLASMLIDLASIKASKIKADETGAPAPAEDGNATAMGTIKEAVGEARKATEEYHKASVGLNEVVTKGLDKTNIKWVKQNLQDGKRHATDSTKLADIAVQEMTASADAGAAVYPDGEPVKRGDMVEFEMDFKLSDENGMETVTAKVLSVGSGENGALKVLPKFRGFTVVIFPEDVKAHWSPKIEGSKVRADGDKLRHVRVTFDDGNVIDTNMAAGVTDEEIRKYYGVGTTFNVGEGENDKMAKVAKVEILASLKAVKVKAGDKESAITPEKIEEVLTGLKAAGIEGVEHVITGEAGEAFWTSFPNGVVAQFWLADGDGMRRTVDFYDIEDEQGMAPPFETVELKGATLAEQIKELGEALKEMGSRVPEDVEASPAFDHWIDTFISEKGIDPEETFEVEGPSGMNEIPYGVIIEHMKITSPEEQKQLKNMIVMLDFKNADIRKYLRHLGQAIAASKKK